MNPQKYTQELRSDSSLLVIPTVAVSVTFLAALGLAMRFHEGIAGIWHLIAVVVLSPISAYVAYQWLKGGRWLNGSRLFVGMHLVLLGLTMYSDWQPGGALPYIAAVFIIASTLMIQPLAGFYTWGASVLVMLAAVVGRGELTAANLFSLSLPFGILLVLAAASYLSSLEWQTAVESVNLLHRRAQQRRDELFNIQEELSFTNKRLEALNQELDEARQAAINERDIRTRFMNNVSHELRTPLNAIVNFAHVMHEGGRGPITERQRDYLSRIETAGWHLLGVLNDLLDMAQIQSGEFKLYLEPTALESICEEAMQNVRGLIMDKDVEVIRDYPDEWPVVTIDEMRMKQALINMLGNSAKYTEEGYIALRVHPDTDSVRIIVEDTGPGIDPKYHKIIFQEFRQVDETAARRRIGTGLGLPITRHLVERHGGTIAVDSAIGEGTRFTITLPYHQGESPESEPAKELAESGTSLEPVASNV